MYDKPKNIEEADVFKPRWDKDGLMPAIVQDATSLEILMLAYMNEESLRITLETGDVTFWSRSRQVLRRKGNTSGHLQRLRDIRIDCDQDALVVLVDVAGDITCHTNRPSCFYRIVESDHTSGKDSGIFLRKMERYQHRLTLDQIAFRSELTAAMNNGDLYLLFQPQIDLTSARVVGAESLIRWRKNGQLISPDLFIDRIEDIGFMNEIGAFTMRRAIEAGALLRKNTGSNIRMSVNVSTTQFADDTLIPKIKSWLSEFNFPSGLLEIEVTETVLLEDFNLAIQRLKEFSNAGIGVALDDFGTGYSSLSYLRQLPINRLKIDQSFVQDAVNNPDDRAITRMIIALGKALNLKIIAEGVENESLERLLLKEDCDEAQGYHYAPALSLDELARYIEQRHNKD